MSEGHDIREPSAASLVTPVRRHAAVRGIAGRLQGGERRIDVTGLRGSAAALVVEALRRDTDRTVVVCCPDAESAEDAASDLRTFSTGLVRLFPEKDIFPQPFELKESLTIRGRRNACLDQILRGEVDIVVTSLAGFLEKTVTVDGLKTRTREISVGERLDMDELREHLVHVGYEAVPTVEALGQFAVRGAIMDIFDPSWPEPVRLEFLDDEIESMRAFDIDTQRSRRALDGVRVLPAVSVVVDERTLGDLATQLRARGLEHDAVDEIVHEIEHHRFSYLLRRYAPAMGMDSSLLDFFPSPPLLFFLDENGFAEALAELNGTYDKIVKLSQPEYPLLDLYDYIERPDTYPRYGFPAVHQWSLRGAGDQATENRTGPPAGENDPKDGVPAMPPPDAVALQIAAHPTVMGKFETLTTSLRRYEHKGMDTYIFSESAAQRERLADMLDEDEARVHLPVGWVTAGFVWESAGLAVLTDHEIFHRNLPRPTDRRKTQRAQGYRHDHLHAGDFVVHVDYGIGRYVGLEKVAVDGGERECLSLRYDGTDRIFVPVDQMPLVEKYVGKEGAVPRLDRLGSAKWQRTKARTRKALEDVAREMLEAHAKREVATGHAFPADTPWQRELEAAFPFEETPHQLRATAEVKAEMQVPQPMERLVCGDVGFGKTEVAIRAAFKAVTGGKQVAILVPTTILALQHLKTLNERLGAFPVRVEMLSRFRSAAEQKQVVRDVADGTVDIVVGTHRLLSKDVVFRDLGLLVIDEEHRFGVRSKEKLKQLRRSVDVLSMTATPIPRTLYMALSGLRPISVIDTPPRNRHPVRTEVLPFDEDTIVQAIRRELARGGQVFFVHNRVASIHSIRGFLERLMPDVRFAVGHGQMTEKELERVILDFLEHKSDVLVCTTIIESGLDFSNVNTIIVNRADRFGLAELYQLRGRVGRRERQAFAYLMVPRNFSVTRTASKRLQAMEEFEELGSGYRLAMRDLEIRGAGNILGVEQHGQLVSVGFELYCKMLKQAVDALQGQETEEVPPCKIETQLPAFLPDTYVADADERMTLYRRLAAIRDPDDVDAMAEEIADRFGRPPAEAVHLVALTRLKVLGMALGVARLRLDRGRVQVEFLAGKALAPALCAQLVETFEGRVLFKSGSTFGLTLTHEGAVRPDIATKLLNLAWLYDKTNNYLHREHPAGST